MRATRFFKLFTSIVISAVLLIALSLLFSSWSLGAASAVQAHPPAFAAQYTAASGSNVGWTQVVADGFNGQGDFVITALEPFGNYLYAGAFGGQSGGQIWRSPDGFTWSPVITTGFPVSPAQFVDDFAVYDGHLYAGTVDNYTVGGEVWRTQNGLDWTRVMSGGFGDDDNVEIFHLITYSDTLYAGTVNLSSGGDVWAWDGATWSPETTDGFGNPNNDTVNAFAVFGGDLYAGTWNGAEGAEIWHRDVVTWTVVMTGGFGTVDNSVIASLATFNNELYALTRNMADGAEIWRTADGTSWESVESGGLGDPNNDRGYGLIEFASQLYYISSNETTGAQAWRSADGDAWEQIGFHGWGNPANTGSYWDNAQAVFNNLLFVGTIKMGDADSPGGEIWSYPHYNISLPLVANEDQYSVLWKASGHGDYTSYAFNHWNEDDPPEIPTTCARCHSGVGFLDYLGEDGSPAGQVDAPAPIRTLIDCPACHNPTVDTMTSVEFPSGAQITGIGREAHCMVCHQGRNSTPSVNGVTSGYGDDELIDPRSFMNPHYLPAGATLYGTEVKGVYEYTGKAYRGRYSHVPEFDTCIECHDAHTLAISPADCTTCHPEAITAADFKKIRYTAGDFDGDGDQAEGLADEIATMRDALLPAIQTYASNTVGEPIVFGPYNFPYFFKDTDGDGVADPDETVRSNSYESWTPRLLRAAYNFQWVRLDYGGYTHNGLYLIQVLYDSLQDIGADVSAMTRP